MFFYYFYFGRALKVYVWYEANFVGIFCYLKRSLRFKKMDYLHVDLFPTSKGSGADLNPVQKS